VGRHVLLIADVEVHAGGELAGRAIEDVHQTGEVRVIALRRKGVEDFGDIDWSPHQGYVLAPQDRLFVLATRGGLSRLLARNAAEPSLP
jgi:Trk K+ transport system NAD-binding subunit